MVQLLLAIIYMAFISFGLPDSLLGAAWSVMYPGFGVPVSYAGMISMIIAGGTTVSSLYSDRMTRRFGAGLVTAVSVSVTALALLGFSLSNSFWLLCAAAVPYGLGAGGVDAALNNYVAVHYSSRDMSWLHCMWGIGASVSPYIMSYALTAGRGWEMGYRYVAVIQIAISLMLFLSLPLWKKAAAAEEEDVPSGEALPLRQVMAIPGAREVAAAFFCYCALEQTVVLWGSSYLVQLSGMSVEAAAGFASLFLTGLTVGRALCGFITTRFTDTQMIRLAFGIISAGMLGLLFPLGDRVTLVSLVVIGFGCGPVYPCTIHSTPEHFGADRSQALIGIQMASASAGTLIMPPLFGLIAQHISLALFPWYLLALLLLMVVFHESLVRKTAK